MKRQNKAKGYKGKSYNLRLRRECWVYLEAISKKRKELPRLLEIET